MLATDKNIYVEEYLQAFKAITGSAFVLSDEDDLKITTMMKQKIFIFTRCGG